jgi:hypothetical protein
MERRVPGFPAPRLLVALRRARAVGSFVYRWPRRLAERFLYDFRARLRLLAERLLAERLLRLLRLGAPNPDRERDRDLVLLVVDFT